MAYIGYLEMSVDLANCQSLKDRRQMVRTIIGKLQVKFNMAAADVSGSEYESSATLAATCISNSADHAGTILDKVQEYIDSTWPDWEIFTDRAVVHTDTFSTVDDDE